MFPHAIVLIKQLDEAASDLFSVESVLDLLCLIFVLENYKTSTGSSSVVLLDVDVFLGNLTDLCEELFDLVELDSKGESSHAKRLFIGLGLGNIGIPTHFIRRLNMREQLIRQVEIIPLEVVVRNIAAGSLSTRFGIAEGTVLPRSSISRSTGTLRGVVVMHARGSRPSRKQNSTMSHVACPCFHFANSSAQTASNCGPRNASGSNAEYRNATAPFNWA